MTARRLRVAVVVQRYGLEINGGAEAHARLFVEHIRPWHDVTVLTTRARDYTSWDRHYPAGAGEVDGTPVIRFDHPQRGHSGRARVPRRHLLRYRTNRLLSALGLQAVAQRRGDPATDGETYLERQGPYSLELMAHLAQAEGHYDVVVFFTALYHPTAAGLPATPVPTVLVPTLHNERSMYHPLMREVFERPGWILWNCASERDLALRLYGAQVAPGSIAGVGIAPPAPDPAVLAAARLRLGLGEHTPYFVWVGRITRSKGFSTLARAFRLFAALDRRGVRLVVLGQGFMERLPQHPRLVYAGFVPDAERDALMAGALAGIVTSRHESLSLVTLESLALGSPVIVNGRSEVLRAHVDDSGAGWVYGPTAPLWRALQQAAACTPERLQALGQAGQDYVRRHYAWSRVQAEWLGALERVARR
ncbi:putative Glycosyltransferase [Rubrivivax sp. A210]|uniref:glycosyltransferase family 4 protein n=1 Tax=Rubrivivax sp. A210 TaxID=2772301 RepID=UPI0019181C4E|nr:glycosyltransferase family 4 protein [Rubrivivax sp. A210]CAD5373969.1 putative Glycosyltransferase [Rubrivivax sp. A210]